MSSTWEGPKPEPHEIALIFVNMKTRRAQVHLDALALELDKWIRLPPYNIARKTDLNGGLQVWRIWMKQTPESIAMLLGDFVCCLRSSLDQLAWGLAHLDPARTFSEREEKSIFFPVVSDLSNPDRERSFRKQLALFPSTVTGIIDGFQPYHRGSAYRDDPLWQLNELWTLDKHRAIPVASSSLRVTFPYFDWERFIKPFDYGLEVYFPLSIPLACPVEFKPQITMEVLFGEYGSSFEISFARIREINNFVRDKVIPRFAGFFT